MSRRTFRKRYILVALFVAAVSIVAANYVPDRSVAELAHWQNEASRFVDVDGMRVHYRRQGNPDGPSLLLLHGTGASLHTWSGWVEALGDAYDVVTVDLPGFGLTGPHPAHDYRIGTYAGFVASFADALGIERFLLAGNSLGGNIAWQVAVRYPDRVQALALLDPSGLPPEVDEPPSLVFRLARAPVLRNVMTWFAPESLYRSSLLEVYADDSKVTDELVQRYRELSLREGNREAFVERSLQWSFAQPVALTQVEAPTLIQWGALDTWIPVSDAERFAQMIPDSQVIIYPDLGHTPMEEAPARTAADARRFFDAPTGN